MLKNKLFLVNQTNKLNILPKMSLTVETTPINNLLVITPKVFKDNRGSFLQIYSAAQYKEIGVKSEFMQDNYSISAKKGTVRGLHYQLEPMGQDKLIHVINGEILNVVVDIRKGSPTFGVSFSIMLSSENHKQLFVPKGFANGFCSLTDNASIAYKVDRPYSPEHERSFIWNDSEIGIDWPVENPILSQRDTEAKPFKEAEMNFVYEARS